MPLELHLPFYLTAFDQRKFVVFEADALQKFTRCSISRVSPLDPLQSSEVPKYLTLIRKEARLREDQIEALATLSRRLNRQRRGKGERITENTLIRVAVDLLLEHEEALAGVAEEEVRESLLLQKSPQQSS